MKHRGYILLVAALFAMLIAGCGNTGGLFSSGGSFSASPKAATLAATARASNGATLNGDVTPNGAPTTVRFEWSTDPGFARYTATDNIAAGSGMSSLVVSARLTGLAPGTTYYYRVSAVNKKGVARGAIGGFRTLNAGTVLMGGCIQGLPMSLAGTTSTVAGSSGGGTNDGIGTAARFFEPWGLATDGPSLFVADTKNHTIRKVTIATGEVTTLAGSPGEPGAVDGTGTAARFFEPRGLATDGTSVYVVDTYNNAIRKVTIATGEVTTLAGSLGSSGSGDGFGTAARFDGPQGLVRVGTDLFVTDTGNSTIRKVTIATAEVTTLAGSVYAPGSDDGFGTAAKFYVPTGLATDGTSLFVADTNNNTIRKVTIATAEVTTLAGSPGPSGSDDGFGAAARFDWPRGLARVGTSLYVTDSENNTIRKVTIATAEVRTVAGAAHVSGSVDGIGAAARFGRPVGLATDGTSLYVTDEIYSNIRRVAIATNEVTILAGSTDPVGTVDGVGAEARFNLPFGVTTDGENLYVADTSNHAIRKMTISTGEVTTPAGTAGAEGAADGTGTTAEFYSPEGITTDGTYLYVSDTWNNTIRKVFIPTWEVTTLAGRAGSFGSTDAAGAAARFYRPRGITTDGTSLFVADSMNHTIRKVSIASGAVTTLAGLAGSFGSTDGIGAAARFRGPRGITTDGTSLFVADYSNALIRKVTISTGEVTTLAGGGTDDSVIDGVGSAAVFSSPPSITTDGTNLYVTNPFYKLIRKVVISTTEVTTLAGKKEITGWRDGTGPNALFNSPYGITTDGESLYVVDTYNYTIRRIR